MENDISSVPKRKKFPYGVVLILVFQIIFILLVAYARASGEATGGGTLISWLAFPLEFVGFPLVGLIGLLFGVVSLIRRLKNKDSILVSVLLVLVSIFIGTFFPADWLVSMISTYFVI